MEWGIYNWICIAVLQIVAIVQLITGMLIAQDYDEFLGVSLGIMFVAEVAFITYLVILIRKSKIDTKHKYEKDMEYGMFHNRHGGQVSVKVLGKPIYF